MIPRDLFILFHPHVLTHIPTDKYGFLVSLNFSFHEQNFPGQVYAVDGEVTMENKDSRLG